MKINFLKQSALDTLKENIDSNIELYKSQDNAWINDFFDNESPFSEFKDEISEFEMDMSEDDPTKTDLNNIKIIYDNLKGLSDSQACDERLWTGLCHDKLWKYMQYRWGKVIFGTDNSSDIKKKIERNYFYGKGSKRRALAFNGIAKLWWIGKYTYDDKLENPYEITEYVVNDFATTTLYLLSSNFMSNREIRMGMFKAILEFEKMGIKIRRNRLNELIKYLNILGGTYLLDTFNEDEIKEKCLSYLNRMLSDEIDKQVQKTESHDYKNDKLEEVCKNINRKANKYSGKQLKVVDYLCNNIHDIKNYKTCSELAKNIGVSTTTVNVVLMKLNLGSYSRFYGYISSLI